MMKYCVKYEVNAVGNFVFTDINKHEEITPNDRQEKTIYNLSLEEIKRYIIAEHYNDLLDKGIKSVNLTDELYNKEDLPIRRKVIRKA